MKKVKKKDDTLLERIKLFAGIATFLTALVNLVANIVKACQ